VNIDLDPFRTAVRLEWKLQTVFVPHRLADGMLRAYDTLGYTIANFPLNVDTPDLYAEDGSPDPPITASTGIVVVDPETLGDVHAAVRAWCKEQFGRDDVEFRQ
jgi:hypothetical protein